MNLSRILKGLLPSFVPLIVYVLADSLFGERIGLYVGLATGGLEFLFILVKDRKPDPFVAADTALLGAMGLVSLLSGNDLFFKLKPAVLELVFGASFALLLVLPQRYLKAYMARQLKGFDLPDSALPSMRRSLGLMLGLLGLHAALTVYAALALSTQAWGFVSGVLLYLFFGLLFLGEFVVLKLRARKARSLAGAGPGEAMLPLVDEEGRITGKAPERLCEAGPGLLHPVLRLFLVDEAGRTCLRRQPGLQGESPSPWDAAICRNLRVGEDLDSALSQALRESLGLTSMVLEAAHAKPLPILRYRHEGAGGSQLVFVFYLSYGGEPWPDRTGGAEVRYFDAQAFNQEAQAGRVSPQLVEEYQRLARLQAPGPEA